MTRLFSNLSTPVAILSFTQPVSAIHVVWLRQRYPLGGTALQLKKEIVRQGLTIEVNDAFDWIPFQLGNANLILLDAFDRVDGTAEMLVARIRQETRVPLVMLTDEYSTEQLIIALSAGADAIWALNTPVAVLLARCKAILRRQFLSTSNRFE